MDGRTDWHCFVRLDLLVPKGRIVCGRNSVVECQLPKLNVVGSNPIARFFEKSLRLSITQGLSRQLLRYLVWFFQEYPSDVFSVIQPAVWP